MPWIRINVSGTVFEFNSKLIEENHRLSQMLDNAASKEKPSEQLSTCEPACQAVDLVVDRPADSFAAILSYYQTGELHIPSNVCPGAFRRELDFWGVSDTSLEQCCAFRYFTFCDEMDTLADFYKASSDTTQQKDDCVPVTSGSRLSRFRQRVWNIVDHRENTVLAKVYLGLVFFMVMLCILTLALSTEPSFQRQLRKCELLEYMEHSGNEFTQQAREHLGNPDCENAFNEYDDYIDDEEMTWDVEETDENLTLSSRNISLPKKTVRLFVFEVLEFAAASFFTFDFVVRLCTCPCYVDFLKSVLNLVDSLALAGFYAHLIIILTEKEQKYEYNWVKFVNYLQIFRALRLFRIVKKVPASRVLKYSLLKNVRDMTLLVLLVLILVSTSACLLYFIESRDTIESIAQGWYWAMITLTTVGYGDITPKTASGQLLAAILAICGVLLLAVTLPMFVNNFMTHYQYSCLKESIAKRKQNDQKKIAFEIRQKY